MLVKQLHLSGVMTAHTHHTKTHKGVMHTDKHILSSARLNDATIQGQLSMRSCALHEVRPQKVIMEADFTAAVTLDGQSSKPDKP